MELKTQMHTDGWSTKALLVLVLFLIPLNGQDEDIATYCLCFNGAS